jgi:geranylgeranyl pyrophosphate synthase
MRSFGEIIGLAFQLADDLLDVTQTPTAMGKATGKDADAGKATLVSLRGEDWGAGRTGPAGRFGGSASCSVWCEGNGACRGGAVRRRSSIVAWKRS